MLGKPFPEDPMEQLWGGIGAVFQSWNGRRAIEYRRIEKIPDEWGTAVNVQAMVFGNMGDTSATGVGFTRDPATGRKIFYGEWLPNAQGEDVVAGIRTPLPINEAGKTEHTRHLPSLENGDAEGLPRARERSQQKLERHYQDMLDIEFTIQEERLWMLQCRVGKRNGVAAVKMAVDMASEKLISKKEAVLRVSPAALVQVLLPMLDPQGRAGELRRSPRGFPPGPGGAHGRIALTADEAARSSSKPTGEDAKVILVRNETSPEDVHGMHAAQAILTAKGGMTSHAALVARGWGKCCIVGCDALEIDVGAGTVRVGGQALKRGDWISLNGTDGKVYAGKLPLVEPDLARNREYRTPHEVGRRAAPPAASAPTPTPPRTRRRARAFGAEGIGLFRTEHMFYGEGADEPLQKLRRMIVASRRAGAPRGARRALRRRQGGHPKDPRGDERPARHDPARSIRRFTSSCPKQDEKLAELADELGIDLEALRKRAEALHETNPMMGHRGVRLGISHPEVTEMQVRAIFEAAAELLLAGKKVEPEIMIPVVSTRRRARRTRYEIIERVYRRGHSPRRSSSGFLTSSAR